MQNTSQKHLPTAGAAGSRRLTCLLGFGLAGSLLAVTACKKDEPVADKAEAKAQGQQAAASDKSTPLPSAVATTPATELQRGEVLAHVLVANPSGLLAKARTQLRLPMADETMLRAQLGAALGDRAAVAQGIDFGRPFGCAMVKVESWACVVGYSGAGNKLATDLGEQGKQADPIGHVAHFRMGQNDLFIDSLGEAAVVSTGPESFGLAKGYLERNIVGRASASASDIELVGYVSAGMKAYEDKIKPFLDLASQSQPVSASGDPKLDKVVQAWSDYNTRSTRDSFETLKDMKQVSIGLGLEPAGLVGRMAIFPVEGSRFQKEAMVSAGVLDTKLVASLPASSWLAFGGIMDRKLAWEAKSSKEIRDLLIQSYTDLMGKDAKEAQAAIEKFIQENIADYGSQYAFAFAYEPNTLGGIVAVQPLQPGRKARDGWKAWSTSFTPDSVLDAETRTTVTWSFKTDADTILDVPVDRWTIEPGKAMRKQIEQSADPKVAALIERLGGAKLVIDRAEVDGKVLFVIAPKAEKAYMKAAIEALRGDRSLADNAGLATVLARTQQAASGLMAIDARQTLAWLRAILPPDEAAKIPPALGNDLSDFYLWYALSGKGAETAEMVVSQPFINQIRALIPM